MNTLDWCHLKFASRSSACVCALDIATDRYCPEPVLVVMDVQPKAMFHVSQGNAGQRVCLLNKKGFEMFRIIIKGWLNILEDS